MNWNYRLGLLMMGLFTIAPAQILAHGGEEVQEQTSGIIFAAWATGILFFVFLVLFLITANKAKNLENVKKAEDREKRKQLSKTSSILRWVWIASLISFVITGTAAIGASGSSNITLEHIHGLGYSPDGKRIMVPAHNGIKVFSEDHWNHGKGEKHDYMGFSAVSDGFYSSGHPAPGSNKKNPFGLVKSEDEGESIKHLTLYGEVDFHLMNVSYNTHTVYVVNPQPNSQMSELGLHYSKDQGKTWTKSKVNGFTEEITALAVHPDQDAIIAAGSQQGVYISSDYGDTFEKIADTQATSLYFAPNGKLMIGGYNGNATLSEMNIESKESDTIEIPALTEDAVQYFAENPVNHQEWVFATFNKDVYLSHDQGASWEQIAMQGKGESD
jgi:phosphoribosyl-AMP cyclohydrolase